MEDDEHDFKTEGRNSNLCYPDHSTLVAENAKDLQGLVIKVKEHNEKMRLKLKLMKTKPMITGATTCLMIDNGDIDVIDSFCPVESTINSK